MDGCVSRCCSVGKDCDVAYMDKGKCYNIRCFQRSACSAVPYNGVAVGPSIPMIAYMDHYLEKVADEDSKGW